MYINTTTLAQSTESEIRAANPNTSFNQPFVPFAGYALIFPAPQPTYSQVTQSVREATPELTSMGHWEQRWTVVPKFTEYTDKDQVLHTVAAQESKAIADDIEAKRVAAIPAEISPRQIRQALTATALRSSVEAAVAAADQDTKDWWEFATTFERAHLRVVGMAQALGVTPRQMDDLWTLGGSK